MLARKSAFARAGAEQLAVHACQLILQLFGAERRPQPGAQLRGLEGFGQVIRRPQLKAAELVRSAIPGGQDDDRDGSKLWRRFDALEQVETIDSR